MRPYLIHYQIHYLNSFTEYGQRYNPWTERVYYRKYAFEFLKSLASTLNTAAQQSRIKGVHKIARNK